MRMKTIVIDAGHGMGTGGKRIPNSEIYPVNMRGRREWQLNNEIAQILTLKLKPYAYNIIRADDRTGAVDVPLSQRVRHTGDLYLSIHHNAGVNGGIGGGTSIYYYNINDASYAAHCYNAVILRAGTKGNRSQPIVRALPPKSLYVLRNGKSQHKLLIECCFMDSVTDVKWLELPEYYENVAQGLAEFILGAFPPESKEDCNGTKAI